MNHKYKTTTTSVLAFISLRHFKISRMALNKYAKLDCTLFSMRE